MGAKTRTKSSSSTKAGVTKKTKEAKSPKPSKPARFANTGLDSDLVNKAVSAVLKYHEKVTEGKSDKLTLIGNDRPVQVQLTLLRAPGKSNPKPAQLLVPHPFYKLADTSDDDSDGVEEPEICLIVKDEAKDWCLTMIEKFPDHMGCVKKVLTLDSLRKKHQSYDQKRQLLSKYNMFMADDRILPMMSKALGKVFIKAKKLPIPITLTRESAVPFVIQKALSATYMTINTGTCISIRAGHTGMAPENLAANVVAIAKAAAKKVPHSWANIQMIGVKTADSVSLPVYNKTPEALREIAKLAGVKTPGAGESAGGDDADKKKEVKAGQSDDKTEEKKKKDLKSPLLQALKKQKKAEDKGSAKKQKMKEPSADSTSSSTKTPEKKTKRSPSPAPTSSTKKKQKKEEAPAVAEEKKNFIAARKFKGSKKGYAFKMGKQGLGYYVDKLPVVNKMAMQALARAGGRGRSSSRTKKGRRR